MTHIFSCLKKQIFTANIELNLNYTNIANLRFITGSALPAIKNKLVIGPKDMVSRVGKFAHEGAKMLQILIYGHFLACSDQ